MRSLVRPLLILLALVLLGVCWSLTLLARANPIPPARSRPRPSLVGTWRATWNGSPWIITLTREGTYAAENGPTVYVGRWHLEGDSLTITETLQQDAGGPVESAYGLTYVFRLRRGTLRGETTHGVVLELLRRAGP